MTFSLGKAIGVVLLSTILVGSLATDASAGRVKRMVPRGYAGYHHHYRGYGDAGAGRAVAGAALRVIGLAAGTAAANAYGGNYGPYGYGYAPAYGYGGYDYAPY